METRQASGEGNRPALRSLTAIAGAVAAVAAVLVGVVLAVVFAATVVVIGVMLSALWPGVATAPWARTASSRRGTSAATTGWPTAGTSAPDFRV